MLNIIKWPFLALQRAVHKFEDWVASILPNLKTYSVLLLIGATDALDLVQQTFQLIPNMDKLIEPRLLSMLNIGAAVLALWLKNIRNRVENRIA